MDRLDKVELLLEKTNATLDRLAVSQEKTQVELRELKESMETEHAETQRSFRELDAKLDKIAAEGERRSRAADKRIDDLGVYVRKLGEKVDKLGDFYGGLSENSGRHAEEFFQDALRRSLTFGDVTFDRLNPNLSKTGSKNCEFDIGLENGTSIALIEVKSRVREEFVEELVTKKLTRFRKFYPEYENYEVYLGLAGFSFEKAVFDEAKKYGVGVIRQVGDAVQVDKGRLKVY